MVSVPKSNFIRVIESESLAALSDESKIFRGVVGHETMSAPPTTITRVLPSNTYS